MVSFKIKDYHFQVSNKKVYKVLIPNSFGLYKKVFKIGRKCRFYYDWALSFCAFNNKTDLYKFTDFVEIYVTLLNKLNGWDRFEFDKDYVNNDRTSHEMFDRRQDCLINVTDFVKVDRVRQNISEFTEVEK